MVAVATWVPTHAEWHSSTDACPQGGYPTGMAVQTLCGYAVTADNDRWRARGTCPTCAALSAPEPAEPTVRHVRYRRGEVGESGRSVHVAVLLPDGRLASACGQRFQPARMEDTTDGMPCVACVQRLASGDRTVRRVLDEHGERGLPR